jgi:hypothetical protein
MKRKLFFTAKFGVALALGLVLLGCPGEDEGGGNSSGPTVINIAAIGGVTVPVTGAPPVTTITPTAQYTGAVTWSPIPPATGFVAGTVYTATITLTAATSDYTLTGVLANFFTVAGTSSPAINAANSGIVTAVFPAAAAGGGGGQQSGAPTVTVTHGANNLVIAWTAVIGAATYKLYIRPGSSEFNADYLVDTVAGNVLTKTTATVAGGAAVAQATSYWVWVRATINGVDGTLSEAVSSGAYEAPTLAPVKAAQPTIERLANGQLKITWAAVDRAESYEVSVTTNASASDNDNDMAAGTYERIPLNPAFTALEYTTTTLKGGTAFNVFIRGRNTFNGNSPGPWSDAYSTSTVGPVESMIGTWQGTTDTLVFTADTCVRTVGATQTSYNYEYVAATGSLTLTDTETAVEKEGTVTGNVLTIALGAIPVRYTKQ